MKKLTFEELCDKLENDENLNGVIVFKQNRSWKKEYSLEELGVVSMNNQEYLSKYVSELIGLITGHLDIEIEPALEVEIIRVILDVYQDYTK